MPIMRRVCTLCRSANCAGLGLRKMAVLLAAVQITIVIRGQLAVTNAAREAARAASVSANPSAAATVTAGDAVSLDDLEVNTSAGRSTVRVVVRARVPTDVPLVGSLIGDVTVSASATMAGEPDNIHFYTEAFRVLHTHAMS